MKRIKLFSVAVVLLIVIVVAALQINNPFANNQNTQNYNVKVVNVGVTYCGNSVSDAKLLVDKVKDYTNLFVVQSNSLQNNLTALKQVCDYAVNAGLNVITYFGTYESQRATAASFVNIAQARWGSHFLGIYYGDEPGGKTLDNSAQLYNVAGLGNVSKGPWGISIENVDASTYNSSAFYFSGQINLGYSNSNTQNYTQIQYFPNGTIMYLGNGDALEYFPNGTVTRPQAPAQTASSIPNGVIVIPNLIQNPNATHPPEPPLTDEGNISQFEPYQKLWDSRPLQTSEYAPAIAEAYVNTQQATIGWIHNQSDVTLFTSDYALQSFDYQSGYDVVLTELGWNQSTTQEIAQARGAANLYGKDWGAMITWKYMQAPYLASGDEIYQQMCQAYENGAKYIAIFNYSPDMQGPYGTLTDDHFQALQRFWTDEVNNASVTRGQVNANAAFVLPNDFGSGLRRQDDIVWGFWSPTQDQQQIWIQLQNALATHGQKLDIVYSDPAHPATEQYATLIYPTFTS